MCRNSATARSESACSRAVCSGSNAARYFLHVVSRSGIGSFGSFSCAANVTPGLELGFMCVPRGLRFAFEKLWVISLAFPSDRSAMMMTESFLALASCWSIEGIVRTGDMMNVSTRPSYVMARQA